MTPWLSDQFHLLSPNTEVPPPHLTENGDTARLSNFVFKE